MKTKQIPLIVMLLAGAVTSITTKMMHYELETSLWILLWVLIAFYIAGCLIKRTIDSFEIEEQETEEEDEGVSDEGAVIEKEASAEDAGTENRQKS